MTSAKVVPVRRIHTGLYVSKPYARWEIRKIERSWWLKGKDGKSTPCASLRSARQLAADLDQRALAQARPSSSPEVQQLRIKQVREHRDHFKATDEQGRVMSTGPLAHVSDAIRKHWPDAHVEMPPISHTENAR